MKCLLIDSYDSFVHIIYQYLEELDVKTEVVRSNKLSIDDIKDIDPDFIVLGPGPGHPSESIYASVLEQFKGSIPILGVCLGHQAICMYFGATIVQAQSLVHGKTSLIRNDKLGVFKDLPSKFSVTRYHSLIANPETITIPLKITATSDDENYVMGVRHSNYPIEGIQFHPESIRTEFGKELFLNFIDVHVRG
ncbi:anthranilate synthase component II [Vibrio sp. DNB22_10_4]